MLDIDSKRFDMSEYTVAQFDESMSNSYQKFVQRNFGKNAYQASSEYINWLYFKNPNGRGYSDFLVVLDFHKDVVGCVHKIRYEIRNLDKNINVSCATIHNLMVDFEHRNGVGFLLLRDLLKKEKSFLVPGVVGKLSDSYRNLGSTLLQSFWGFKLIKPNLLYFSKLLLGHKITDQKFAALSKLHLSDCVQIQFDFSEDLLNIVNKNSNGFLITKEYLNWRLFDDGKKSTIVLWSHDKKSVFIIGLGKRKNVPVGRVFFCVIDNLEDGRILLRNTFRFLGSIGYPLVLITASDLKFVELAKLENIRPRSEQPDSYFYSKLITLDSIYPWPLVSDLGFEERFSKEQK